MGLNGNLVQHVANCNDEPVVLVQMTVINGDQTEVRWPQGGALSADWSDEDDQILAAIQHERKSSVERGLPE